MKFSVMTLPLLPMPAVPGMDRAAPVPQSCSLTELYGQIRAAGADALDISSMDLQYGGERAVLEALQENALICSCYLAFISAPAPDRAGQQKAAELGMQAVEQTRRLGSNMMMFVPAGYSAAAAVLRRAAMADALAEVLRPVVRYAAERDVTVVIEDAPHQDFPMCTEAELQALLEQTPGLKLVYDSGNMCFAGEDPVSYYDHLAGYVAHAHAKDVIRLENGQTVECPHGKGMVDFRTIFAHMRRRHFDGYTAVELSPGSGEPVTDRVRNALDLLQGCAEEGNEDA